MSDLNQILRVSNKLILFADVSTRLGHMARMLADYDVDLAMLETSLDTSILEVQKIIRTLEAEIAKTTEDAADIDAARTNPAGTLPEGSGGES